MYILKIIQERQKSVQSIFFFFSSEDMMKVYQQPSGHMTRNTLFPFLFSVEVFIWNYESPLQNIVKTLSLLYNKQLKKTENKKQKSQEQEQNFFKKIILCELIVTYGASY